MRVTCFTSFTFSYLDRARVLFQSLRRHQPAWKLVALITDEPPSGFEFHPSAELFDEVVYAKDLGIPRFPAWIFSHDVVEACTAVKGPYLLQCCVRDGADAVVYLDPDTCVFASLDPLEELLTKWDIVLTPHTTKPEEDHSAILDNELSPLRTGVYNLGFCAVRCGGDGLRFAEWWSERLLEYCYDDIPQGLFVDQRWCDLVPALFESVKILRDPGYNVASWNISRRLASFADDGALLIDGVPLRFWHFTKLGPVADAMTRRYARDNFPVYEIWNWYRRQIEKMAVTGVPARYWAYSAFENGALIEKRHRIKYRSDPQAAEIFTRPFAVGQGSFYESLVLEGLA